MPQSNGSIYAPVEIRDAYNCLGVASYNNNFDLTYICCNEHNITNIQSLKKPIRSNQREELHDGNYRDSNYGYNIPSFTTKTDLDNAIDNNISWTYLSPRPNIDWNRLTDWNGYLHNQRVFSANTALDVINDDTITIPVGWNNMSDFTQWAEWRDLLIYPKTLLILAYCKEVNKYYICNEGDSFNTIPSSFIRLLAESYTFKRGRDYKINLILTVGVFDNNIRKQWENANFLLSNKIWLLPNTTKLRLTNKNTPLENITVQITNSTYESHSDPGGDYFNGISCSYIITNSNSSPITLVDCKIFMSTYDPYDQYQYYYIFDRLDNISISNNNGKYNGAYSSRDNIYTTESVPGIVLDGYFMMEGTKYAIYLSLF